MEQRYIAQLNRVGGSYSFASWLPTFGRKIRPAMPGDIITFVAGTGVGKTALLQNMAWRAAPTPYLLFEMELADSITFERFVSGTMGLTQHEVEEEYRRGNPVDWRDSGWLSNIYVCPQSGLTASQIETIINKAELKMGVRPVVVGIDYAQLVVGMGKSRYEKMTSVMSDIKSMGKNTGTVIAITSQTNTRGADSVEVGLSDGKDSGQIENSTALHIGAWRDPNDDDTLILRVNKNTRGYPGLTIRCNWDGPRMMITEKVTSPIEE
jgi:replicative DNA helicase